MNTRLPGNLGEIFPLRFRLREELRFFQVGELVIAEKVKSGQRYSVKPWQHEMLMSFDGTTTFEIGADIRTNSAFTKSGAGTVRLSGNNTTTGSTTIHEGVLEVTGGNGIGDNSLVTLANHRNSTLRLLASETIGRLDGGQRQTDGDWGIVDVGSHTLTLNHTGGNTNFSGRFTGSGSIVMSAASTTNFALFAVSDFTGTVEVNGGLFQLVGVG